MTTRVLLLSTALIAAPLLAQSDHRLQVFGGFAHQREDNLLTGPRNGWVASQTAYIRPWIGVEVELSGQYGSYDAPAFGDRPATPDQSDNLHTYLFGPRIRLVRKRRFAISGHTLFGVAQNRFDAPLFFEDLPFPVTTEANSTGFGSAVGAALDIHFFDRFSWRIQPDWIYRRGTGPDHSLRVSTGIVFRFGK